MPIMLWDQSLDVGVESMNREHREILTLMNKIFDAAASGQKGAAINSLVAALGQVCAHHFADEEEYMRVMQFPGLQPHKLLHQSLLAKYTQHAAEISAAGGVAGEEFFRFLKFWLSSHIHGVDMKYGPKASDAAAA